MFGGNYISQAFEKYNEALARYESAVRNANAATERANAAVQCASARMDEVEKLLSRIQDIPVQFADCKYRVGLFCKTFQARDFRTEAFEDNLKTSFVTINSAALTVLTTKIAKRFLARNAKMVAVRVCGVAAKSVAGPIGGVLLGLELAQGLATIWRSSKKKADEAIDLAQNLAEETHRISLHTAEFCVFAEKISKLSCLISSALQHFDNFGQINFDKLDESKKDRLFLILNTVQSILVLVDEKKRGGAA